MHLQVIKDFLKEDELQQVIQYHYQISQGLGHPVWLINMLHRVPPNESEMAHTQKYAVENLYDRVQNTLAQLLEKTNNPQGGAKEELLEGRGGYAEDEFFSGSIDSNDINPFA